MARRIIDLSVTVDTNTMSPPSTDLKVELTHYRRGPGFWQSSAVSQGLHTGSHVDSRLHCYDGAETMAEVGLNRVIGPAIVVDCTDVQDSQPVTVRHLEPYADRIEPGDIVLLHTGWTDRMFGKFPEFFTRSPFLDVEAARWLAERPIHAVGFDFFEEYCARLPAFNSEDFICHRILLDKGIILMEGVTNLAALPSDRVDFFAPFYKIAGTEGAGARFFALVSDAE
ncbi:MAG: cyclase family protein [Chloroflexi bacterium]|nr:cyclase family protein [Chloroflexota bacterium]